MTDISKTLDTIMERVRDDFAAKNVAREKALPLCREAIRFSANAIRAVHRNDFATAQELVGKAGTQVATAKASLAGHADIYHAGFVHDSQKEFAEASITLALISGRRAAYTRVARRRAARVPTAWARQWVSCAVTCSIR
jgi:translin